MMPWRSVPAPGSVSAMPERISPAAIPGRYRAFCSSVPWRETSQQATECGPNRPVAPSQARAISSKVSA